MLAPLYPNISPHPLIFPPSSRLQYTVTLVSLHPFQSTNSHQLPILPQIPRLQSQHPTHKTPPRCLRSVSFPPSPGDHSNLQGTVCIGGRVVCNPLSPKSKMFQWTHSKDYHCQTVQQPSNPTSLYTLKQLTNYCCLGFYQTNHRENR